VGVRVSGFGSADEKNCCGGGCVLDAEACIRYRTDNYSAFLRNRKESSC
jgi:hypothetical protein